MKQLRCRECGQEIYINDKRCSNCGAPLNWLKRLTTCRDCGEIVSRTAPQCPSCGVRTPCKEQFITQVLVLVFVIPFLIIFTCSLFYPTDNSNHPQTSTNSGSQANYGQEEPKPVEIIEVNAVDLWNAYRENEVRADLRYGNKTVIVTGTVTEIGKDAWTNRPYITLDVGSQYDLYSVLCIFVNSTKNQSDLALLSEGDTVSICGSCSGLFSYNIEIKNCALMK